VRTPVDARYKVPPVQAPRQYVRMLRRDAAAPVGRRATGSVCAVRRADRSAPILGRRVLRAPAGRDGAGSTSGAAAGAGRNDLEQAALLLRRAAVAAGRSRAAAAAAGARPRAHT